MIRVEISIPPGLFEEKTSGLKSILLDLQTLCSTEVEKIVGFEESWSQADKEAFEKEIVDYVAGLTMDVFLMHFKSFKRLRLSRRTRFTRRGVLTARVYPIESALILSPPSPTTTPAMMGCRIKRYPCRIPSVVFG